MVMTTDHDNYRPGAWLRELVRIKPASWPWGQSIRGAVCMALPWGIGLATDNLVPMLWVALGALLASTAEPADGSYRLKIRQVIAAPSIGILGFFVGYVVLLPWPIVVLTMGLAGILAGIVSGWGAKASLGALQFLLLASISIGIPGDFAFLHEALLFACGAALFLALLMLEAAVLHSHPHRALIARLTEALAELAQSRSEEAADHDNASSSAAELARRKVTAALAALGSDALAMRSTSRGRSTQADALAAVLERGDNTFAAILASGDSAGLATAARQLQATAGLIRRGETPDPAATASPPRTLAHCIETFSQVAAAGSTGSILRGYETVTAPTASQTAQRRLTLGRLVPGREILQGAAALGLCLAIAYSVYWFREGPHWFWVPLTVSLIMKPDLGSLFARAVLRSVGTIGGALIGAAMLTLLPKGPELVVLMALLAAMLPWAVRLSYAVQGVVLTPLVLVLISIIQPEPVNVDFGGARIVDTAIGSVIVLIFGYFIWPRRKAPQLAATMQRAKQAMTESLIAIAERRDAAPSRRRAYAALSDLRAQLQKLMVEPPPANHEAAAWFPLVAGVERICDRITVFSVTAQQPLAAAETTAVHAAAALIASSPRARIGLAPVAYDGSDKAVATLIAGVNDELQHLTRLENTGPVAADLALG